MDRDLHTLITKTAPDVLVGSCRNLASDPGESRDHEAMLDPQVTRLGRETAEIADKIKVIHWGLG